METFWNDPLISPLVASLIYSAGISDNSPKNSLLKKWYDLKSTFDRKYLEIGTNQSDPPFIKVYNSLVKKYKYSYCVSNFNFLLQFYENGLCNCECGTYLAYQLNELFPSPNFMVLFSFEVEHVKLAVYNKTTKALSIFETTGTPAKLVPTIYFSNNPFIYSEQLVGFNIIANSLFGRILKYFPKNESTNFSSNFISDVTNTINNMINSENKDSILDISSSSLSDLILKSNRKLLNTKKIIKNGGGFSYCMLDNTNFNRLLFLLHTSYLKNTDIVPILYEKSFAVSSIYVKKDFQDLVSGVIPTPEEINERNTKMLFFFQKLLDKYK